ncbi:MAG: T9SS type A sorting domain-containing protein [Bacteroidetes bacterium]|nr:T9SS type A sorting domain-containing protein [Bacteroidota bacterium]
MKKITTLLLSGMFALAGYSQVPDLPITFDNSSITYTLVDFGGNASKVAADPKNSSNKVAEVTKTNTAQTWAGTTIGPATGLANKIPFSSSSYKILMKVYSPDSGIVIRLKAEDPNDGTKSVETDAKTTKKNSWETLEFDFTKQAAGTAAINYSYTYQKLSVFFNFGVDGATAGTKTYYCDDIQMAVATKSQIDLPVSFEGSSVDYTMIDFGGNVSSLSVDPVVSTNTAAKVVKGNTAELWAGTTIGTASGFANKIPFTANTPKITVRIYSPDSGIVIRLKAENAANGSISVETDALTTKKNTWETLEFDFTKQVAGTAAINYSNTYQKLSIFFNFGVTGATAGAKTYYFDDVKMGAAINAQIDLPVTFDATKVDYTMIDFGGNVSSVVTDPTASTNKVAQVVKGNTAELWAGTTIGTAAGFAKKIPFTANTPKMTMRVWSPDSGIVVRLKAEDPANPTVSVETDALTTKKNAWQTLEFDFSKQANGTAAINYGNTYQKLSVFFNFGVTGATAGKKTYYFDDVQMGDPLFKQIDMPVTFDAKDVDYTMIDFGGNMSSVDVDPKNAANKVGKAIKSATAELWAGTTIGTTTGFANNIPFDATHNTIIMKVYSPDAGIVVKLKAEDINDPSKSVETDVSTTVANKWEVLRFDFTKNSNGTPAINYNTSYKKLSVFFNFGVTGATAGVKTYYFDSVAMGGSSAPSKVNITFRVDARNVTLGAGEVLTLNGSFNNWCGACAPMTKAAGSDVWSLTIPLDTATEYEYKFVVGNWVKDEKLAVGLPCVKTTGQYTNRVFRTALAGDSLPVVCWESCQACGASAVTEQMSSNLRIFPNPANGQVHIEMETAASQGADISIMNTIGQEVLKSRFEQGRLDTTLDISSLRSGIYLINIKGKEQSWSQKLQVQ